MDGVALKAALSLFKGKKVLVIGDTGFKGSWLSLWLHELGSHVLGYALKPEHEEDHFRILGMNQIIRHVDGDIRDKSTLEKVFHEFDPEFVFHLAAQPLVRLSYLEPGLTFDTNVSGSVNILEMVRKMPSIRVIVYVTSDKCYKNKEWVWGYRENDELGGRDPYSASKAAAEIVFFSYYESFFKDRKDLGAASVRAGNVIGGGDWSEDRILPDCIKALRNRKPIKLRNPWATRPWQHVLEPLGGYLLLAARLYETPQKFSGSWNFGPRVESVRTVKDLTEKVIKLWGHGKVVHEQHPNALYEAHLLQLNCDKASIYLNWRPQWSFERSVEETVMWYKKVAGRQPALPVTKQQIKNYLESFQ